MLAQVVQSIGWKHPDDRDTIIRKEQLEQSIVKLQKMSSDLRNVGGSVGKYVNDRGIYTKVPKISFHYCQTVDPR